MKPHPQPRIVLVHHNCLNYTCRADAVVGLKDGMERREEASKANTGDRVEARSPAGSTPEGSRAQGR